MAESEHGLRRFFKHSSIYAIGNIANRVGAFVLLPLYTHYMTVEHYGALEMFYVSSDIISSLMSIGLAHATLRFYFEYPQQEDRNQVVTTCLLSTALYATLFVLVLSRWNAPLSRMIFDDVRFAGTFNIVYGIIVFELMRQIGLAYLRAREYSTLYVGVCLIQLFIQVGCNIYTVGVLKLGVTGVLTGNLISIVAGWLFVMVTVVRECGLGFNLAKMKSVLNYSYPFVFTAIIGMAMQNADRILLRIFFSLREVGIYSLAFKFGSLLPVLLLEPFNRSFGAYRFSIMNAEHNKDILIRVQNYLAVAVSLLGVGISLYSAEVLRLMTEPSFWDARSVIPLIVLAFAFTGPTYVFQTGILYAKKTPYMIYISTISGVINLLLYGILIPAFGTYGAALAVASRNLTETVLTYVISNRLYAVPHDLFRTGRVLAVSVFVVAASIALAPDFLPAALLLKTALIVALPFMLYAFGCITAADVEAIRSILESAWNKVRNQRLWGAS